MVLVSGATLVNTFVICEEVVKPLDIKYSIFNPPEAYTEIIPLLAE